jgi:hypothetical protein
MRGILAGLVALALVALNSPCQGGEREEKAKEGEKPKVRGTTEGGLAREAGLPGQPPEEREEDAGARVGHYFLHRWLDLVDIVDFSFGAGPGFLINVRATKIAQLVGGVSDSWRVGFRGRSAGVWREKRREAGFSLLYYQKVEREKITGWVESFRSDKMDMDTAEIYLNNNDRSFSGVGATIHAGIVVDINVRPMQAMDFVLGLFTIDVLDDDYNKAVRNKDL